MYACIFRLSFVSIGSLSGHNFALRMRKVPLRQSAYKRFSLLCVSARKWNVQTIMCSVKDVKAFSLAMYGFYFSHNTGESRA